jgi:hypothetical protein
MLHRLAKEIREAVERGHLAFAVRLLGEHVISQTEKENDMATIAGLKASIAALALAVTAEQVKFVSSIQPTDLDPIQAGIDAQTTALGGTPPASTGAPVGSTAPAGLTATPTTGQIALAWTPVAGANTYNVYRSTATGTEGPPPLNTSPLTSPSYIDSTTVAGTAYFYTVTSVITSPLVESSQSAEVTATAV